MRYDRELTFTVEVVCGQICVASCGTVCSRAEFKDNDRKIKSEASD